MSGVLHGVIASLKTAVAAVTDAYWKYVSLLLNTTSTNGAQNNTFLDASTNNFTVTRNGDTTQGSFTPYMPTGYWSGYFDGTGDYIALPANAVWPFSGDVTFECWINITGDSPTDSGGAKNAVLFRNAVTGTVAFQFMVGGSASTTGTSLSVYSSGGLNISATFAFSKNTWYHVAAVRASTVWNLYVNGVSYNSGTFAGTIGNASYTMEIGGSAYGGYPNTIVGYISNARIVKGTAVYTGNFTPPTTPLTAISGTSLLCLQDNRFKDNSTNAFTITRNGDTRISKFAPLSIPYPYTPANYGWSGYFDGTGDFLSVADNAALDLGSSDFTIEAWIYLTAAGGINGRGVISKGSATGASFLIFQGSTNELSFYASSTGTTWDISSNQQFSSNITLTTWHHIAVTRSGSTFRLFLNGTQTATFTSSSSLVDNASAVEIGTYSSFSMQGYISNLRIVKGTAVYTAAFTPPTTPLTAITNTSLLLNFTNAGIYDAATINDAQTVGNAQVSTVQTKFGTTSMYFDGTGDWLTVLNKPELNIGTGDFTIECWINRTATASGAGNADAFLTKGTNNIVLSINVNTSKFGFGQYGVASLLTSTTTVSNGTWYHVAVTRSGTTLRMFIDGTQEASTTSSANFTSTTNMFIGADANNTNQRLNGYIDELRITNGYARYTGNFTPPTAAFPTL